MSHKLTGEALKYVADNLKTCTKYALDKRKMYVSVDNAAAGQRVCQYLMSAYGAKSYDTILGGWGDFVLKFDYMWQRDNAVLDVNAAVQEYLETHNTPLTEYDDPTPSDSTAIVEEDEESASNNNLTTYIIIGAAAIIIALLLWKSK